MRGAVLVACVLIASCGGVLPDQPGPGPGPGSGSDTMPGTPPLAPVTFKVTLNWLDDTGQVTATEDATNLLVRDVVALVPDPGAKGGFATRAAEMTGPGLAIRDIPENTTYYLDVPSLTGRMMFVTDEREIDLKLYELGRHEPAQPTMATPLTVDVTSMTAWQDGDTLALYCAHVDAFGGIAASQPGVTGWPVAGDTHLVVTVDWANVDRGLFQDRMTPLIDSNLGDRLIVSHGRRQGSSLNYVYDAPLETATFAPFTQSDGVRRTVNGAFGTDSHDAVHVQLKRSEFVRYAQDIHPDAMINPAFLGGGGVGIRTQPADPNHQRAFSPFSPSMLFTLFNADTTDLDLGQMTYPHPPSSWSQWLQVSHGYLITRDTPFGLAQTVAAGISVTIPITPGSPASDIVTVAAPRISPPRKAILNGVAFAAPHIALFQPTGAPIELTWDEPILVDAAPTSYILTIVQLDRTGDQLTTNTLATVSVPAKQRSLAIPWQLFPGPGAYYFLLTAIAAEGAYDPGLGGVTGTDSGADAMSGILTMK